MKIENLIEENYEKLNDNDIYIWNYISIYYADRYIFDSIVYCTMY